MDKKVHLSPIGEIVTEEWVKTETIRSNVRLDAWIIMPDHMHMLVEIIHAIERRVATPRRGVATTLKPRILLNI